jgi:hypothetical protein
LKIDAGNAAQSQLTLAVEEAVNNLSGHFFNLSQTLSQQVSTLDRLVYTSDDHQRLATDIIQQTAASIEGQLLQDSSQAASLESVQSAEAKALVSTLAINNQALGELVVRAVGVRDAIFGALAEYPVAKAFAFGQQVNLTVCSNTSSGRLKGMATQFLSYPDQWVVVRVEGIARPSDRIGRVDFQSTSLSLRCALLAVSVQHDPSEVNETDAQWMYNTTRLVSWLSNYVSTNESSQFPQGFMDDANILGDQAGVLGSNIVDLGRDLLNLSILLESASLPKSERQASSPAPLLLLALLLMTSLLTIVTVLILVLVRQPTDPKEEGIL